MRGADGGRSPADAAIVATSNPESKGSGSEPLPFFLSALAAIPARRRQRIVSKIMGLITAVIGIQFVINGVTTVFVSILKAVRDQETR